MSLYKRNDSSVWWLKIRHNGQAIQRSTGTEDKLKAQEYHDRLKASLWEHPGLALRLSVLGRKRSCAGCRKYRTSARILRTL